MPLDSIRNYRIPAPRFTPDLPAHMAALAEDVAYDVSGVEDEVRAARAVADRTETNVRRVEVKADVATLQARTALVTAGEATAVAQAFQARADAGEFQGLPGTNAVPAAAAVAGYMASPGNPVYDQLQKFTKLPASWDVNEALNLYRMGPQGIAGWTTGKEVIALSLGWEIATDKKYGAIPDGTTDNSAAFARIAAALNSGPSKQTVFFPPGRFLHNGLVIDGKANFELHGPGELVAKKSRVDAYVIIKNCSNFKLTGLDSRHQDPTLRRVSPARCFSLENCRDFDVFGCHAHHGEGVGIMLNHCSYGRVTNNKVDNTKADGIGLYGDTHHISVVANTTSYTGDDGIAQVGVTTQGVFPHHNTITGNTVEWSDARGIVAVGAEASVITANTINDTRAGGIYVSQETSRDTYGCRDIIVSNNTIDRANTWEPTIIQAGICVYGGSARHPVESISVFGNTVRGSRVRGMQLGMTSGDGLGTRRVAARDNLIQESGTAGISVYGIQDVDLIGNRVYDSGSYGIYGAAGITGHLNVRDNLVTRPNAGAATTYSAISFNEAVTVDTADIVGNTVREAESSAIALDAPPQANVHGNNVGNLAIRGGSQGRYEVFGNLHLSASAAHADPAGGRGVFAMRNSAQPPTANPSFGGVLYVEAGALKFRGQNGTITVLAPA